MNELNQLRSEPKRRSRQVILGFAAALGGILIVALLRTLPHASERSVIERLPSPERSALYERTQRTLESSCALAEQWGGLDDFCRDQARFVLQFPECDAGCQALAARYRGAPPGSLSWRFPHRA